MVLGSRDTGPSPRQPEATHDGNDDISKQKVEEAEEWLPTRVLNFLADLCNTTT